MIPVKGNAPLAATGEALGVVTKAQGNEQMNCITATAAVPQVVWLPVAWEEGEEVDGVHYGVPHKGALMPDHDAAWAEARRLLRALGDRGVSCSVLRRIQ